jgi:hypothetical protein
MFPCTTDEMSQMTNCELTLLAFQAGMAIAGRKELDRDQLHAKDAFVAAYRELLRRPLQTGSVPSPSGKPLTWRCSHAGFEMHHPEFGKVGMIRDRRSATGYRIMMDAAGAARAAGAR